MVVESAGRRQARAQWESSVIMCGKEASWLRSLLIVGFILVGLLCCLTNVVKFDFVLTAIGLGLTVVLGAAYALGQRRIAVVGVLVLAAVLLVPNDDCGNAFNARWIRYVGASPLMFIPNVLVILVTVCACLGIRPAFACVVAGLICLSTLVLGIGHMSGIIW